jgi:hypothetical protein
MIGEFEYDSIFNDQDPNDPATLVNNEPVTYMLFVVFMVIMSIIIMNLLVSLCREVFCHLIIFFNIVGDCGFNPCSDQTKAYKIGI